MGACADACRSVGRMLCLFVFLQGSSTAPWADSRARHAKVQGKKEGPKKAKTKEGARAEARKRACSLLMLARVLLRTTCKETSHAQSAQDGEEWQEVLLDLDRDLAADVNRVAACTWGLARVGP